MSVRSWPSPGSGNVALLAEQARHLGENAVTADPSRLDELRAALEGAGIEATAGAERQVLN